MLFHSSNDFIIVLQCKTNRQNTKKAYKCVGVSKLNYYCINMLGKFWVCNPVPLIPSMLSEIAS